MTPARPQTIADWREAFVGGSATAREQCDRALAGLAGEGARLGAVLTITADRARAQAGEFGETPGRETARLVIHGVLHLLGYDDATPRQRKAMTAREDRYLERLFRRTRATT